MDASRQYYTVHEANAQLAVLRELFARVMQIRSQLKTLYNRLDEHDCAPTEEELLGDDDWEDDEDLSSELRRDRAVFGAMVETLREQVECIQDTGCVIKDIETGLVDWYALHDGREVLLCWRYGEHDVAHWHEIETGVAGRRPVSELDSPGKPQADAG